MLIATQRIRVEWAHCDGAGIIFNPNYYIWMDGGAHALLQVAGFDFIARTRDDSDFLGCPLVASNMEFRRPLYFGDVVTLASRVQKFGNKSFVIAHEFGLAGAAEPVAMGSEVRVWAHSDSKSTAGLIAQPIPESVKSMLMVEKSVDVSV